MGTAASFNLSTLSGDALLLDVLGEFLGPFVIVRRNREFLYKSAAFDELTGTLPHERRLRCDLLILPTAGRCCLDAVASYPKGVTSGLWNLKQASGAPRAVHVRWRPITVGSRTSLLAMRFEPVPAHASSIATGFFVALRRAAGGLRKYWRRVFAHLEQVAAVRRSLLVSAGEEGVEVLAKRGFERREIAWIRRTLEGACTRTRDIFVPSGRTLRNVRAVSWAAADGTERVLVFETPSGQITHDLLDIVLAALSAADAIGEETAGAAVRELHFEALIRSLAPAEAEVLRMIVSGLTDKEIARRRRVSPWTVKNQVRSILHKTGAARRVDLVRRLR